MVRPCFLVVDQEHAGSISSRKLVLETAKFNVITAYSCEEALETLQLFPNVHGVVMNAAMRNENCSAFFGIIRAEYPVPKLFLVGECPFESCPCDYRVESYSPAKLLVTLKAAFPDESASLQRTESHLERNEF